LTTDELFLNPKTKKKKKRSWRFGKKTREVLKKENGEETHRRARTVGCNKNTRG
jgi:hypothetical protein